MGEIYVGVKFEVVHLPEEELRDARLGELIRAGKCLAEQGFCPENSGNMSFRFMQGFAITAAGSRLGNLCEKDFIIVKEVNIPGKKVVCAGQVQPSSEAMMHQMIYDARKDVQVILHAHALELRDAPVTVKAYPYGTLEFARSAVEVLKSYDRVILKDHGFVVLGKTVSEALGRVITDESQK